MGKIISNQDKKSTAKLSEWDIAIKDAQQKIARLKTAIQTFEEMKATGQPWPHKRLV